MDACVKQGLGYSSIWGHTPHYLQAAPNFRVAYSLLQTLTRLLRLSMDLDELRGAASKFDDEVAKAVQADDQIGSYVAKLEGQYDESVADSSILDPEDLVRDVERFLRGER
jgi:proteasome assembly chaperone (PAC2) family protein